MMDQVMVRHYTHQLPMQPAFTTRPDIRGTFGAVATTHWLATQTGMAVLERGGNAFDAAGAAGLVLPRSGEHTAEPPSPCKIPCPPLLEKKKTQDRGQRDP